MKPVDAFLHSVRTAFRAEDGGDGVGWAWAILAVAVVGLGLVVARMRAQRRTRQAGQAAFARLAAEKKLSTADEALIGRLAARVAAAPQVVGTHLDVFERATAALLGAALAPAAGAPVEGLFAEVGRLRRTLGFHVLPEQFPLLTTRELVSGVRVDVGGVAAMVGEVNEAWFDVECSAEGVFSASVDQTVRVAFVRGGEARYVARCAVAAGIPAHAPRQLILRHDERPERTQKRNAVRVTVRGEIHLRPRPVEAGASEEARDEGVTHGELVDLSIGGMAIAVESKLAVGTALRASFDWEGSTYADLPVVVLQCEARSRNVHVARLQFRGLGVADENRLAAAIARRSAHAPPAGDGNGDVKTDAS